MTAIIGWQNDLVASAALLIDGRLVGATEEERFTRVKQQEGFPSRSISWLLRAHGLRIDDIDEWPYGWFAGDNSPDLLPHLCRRIVAVADDPEAVNVMIDRLTSEHRKDLAIRARGIAEAHRFGIPLERISYVEHHPAHAWSAFACSPFTSALVVTADGRGDRKSITVSTGDTQGLMEHEWYSSIDSLGHLYSQVTHALGFTTNRHEGKVTGLAAHGDPTSAAEFLRTLVDWRDDRIMAHPGARFRPTDTDIPAVTLKMMRSFAPADLAAGVQKLTEELVCRLVETRICRYGQSHVALAGGLFANVQVNRRIRELPDVTGVFVQPNMGDAGLSLGSAAAAWHRRTGTVKIELPHVYLGPDSSEESPTETPCAIFETPEETIGWTVEQLRIGTVVGLVRGRCEFGPRALGHRSILVRADDASINQELNKRLHRTEFMPFAPVIREEDAAQAFLGWRPEDKCAPFMTMAYECTPEFVARHPAVVHVDRTARPQVVERGTDPFLHELLTRYQRRTGQVALVNTSFNAHEEPIVGTLNDALRLLSAGGVDVVCTDNAAYGRFDHSGFRSDRMHSAPSASSE